MLVGETANGSYNLQDSVIHILVAAKSLFGEPILTPPKVQLEPAWLLALIAHAWMHRQKLHYPARIVSTELKNGWRPDPIYFSHPEIFLPANFFPDLSPHPDPLPKGEVTLPLPSGEGWGEGGTDGEGEVDVEGGGDDECWEDEQSEAEITGVGLLTWRKACQLLAPDLPVSVVRRFLEPLEFESFDPDCGILTVSAPDKDCQVWVLNRLKRNLERILESEARMDVKLEVKWNKDG